MLRRESVIEFATDADVDEIGYLSKIYVEHDLGWQYTPQRIKELIRNRAKNVVVARSGDELAGFGIMTYMEESANLDLLAVKIAYRRRGIGRQLVAWLEKVARTAGIIYLFVQVRKMNQGAIRFYEQIGFHPIDEQSGYYRGKETGVIMCKGLREIIRTL
jgi:ribosomal protein S18 acetylase RimI-like enzyme